MGDIYVTEQENDKVELGRQIAKILSSGQDAETRLQRMHSILKESKAPANKPIYDDKNLRHHLLGKELYQKEHPKEYSDLELEIVNNFEELYSCFNIRREVFTVEQGVPQNLDLDEYDQFAIHFMVQHRSHPIATARLLPLKNGKAKLGRMAVLQEHRKHKVGSRLIKFVFDEAVRLKISEIIASAQESSANFYAKHGFHQVGIPYEEAGMSHVRMVKQI